MACADISADQRYRLDEQVGFLMRLANQRHTLIFQSHMVENLTPTQFSTLMRLAENGQASQNHLGRLAAMDIATTKGVVDRLKAKGLVRGEADQTDKRRSLITLTDKGQALIAQLEAAGTAITSETLAPLTAREQDTLITLLKKLA
jgi:DNA-binding MarR family transcriptional regulator